MKHNYRLLSVLGILAIGLSACELYNPSEPIPGYIHIDKINLSTYAPDEGSNSSKISDAWVYVDDQLLGCFELPFTAPVIAEGTHTVKIRAGIKINGISANRSPYPFYDGYIQQINFQPGKVVNLSPTVTYHDIANFRLIDVCEVSAGVHWDTTTASSTPLNYVTAPAENVFEGTGSMLAHTKPSAGKTFFEFVSVDTFALPKGGAPVFLEFNYKCNYEFTVSIIAWGTSGLLEAPVLHFNPSTSWNKTYTYLTPVVSSAYTATGYQLQFGSANSSADSTYLLLDNIKLIH